MLNRQRETTHRRASLRLPHCHPAPRSCVFNTQTVCVCVWQADDNMNFAKKIKGNLQRKLGWQTAQVKLDSDALIGGAEKHVDPHWAEHYRTTMEETPAMLIVLTNSWCKTKHCADELIWFLAHSCGVDLDGKTPAEVTRLVFLLSEDELEARPFSFCFVPG